MEKETMDIFEDVCHYLKDEYQSIVVLACQNNGKMGLATSADNNNFNALLRGVVVGLEKNEEFRKLIFSACNIFAEKQKGKSLKLSFPLNLCPN